MSLFLTTSILFSILKFDTACIMIQMRGIGSKDALGGHVNDTTIKVKPPTPALYWILSSYKYWYARNCCQVLAVIEIKICTKESRQAHIMQSIKKSLIPNKAKPIQPQ
jgi:hypothetical protein